MFLFKSIDKLQAHLDNKRSEGEEIGFVPTLGALHDGHGSLVNHSIEEGLYTIVSIYVNPTQFNDPEDLKKYPRPTANDLQYLHTLGADVVFLPSDEMMYPGGTSQIPEVDLGSLGNTLEAAFRPGHFEGVLQIVYRLLEIVEPDYLFMGKKDLQQLTVIRELIRQIHLPVQLVGLPIVRESHGLARSSRNERLSTEDRENASIIYDVMKSVATNYNSSTIKKLRKEAMAQLDHLPFHPEYFEFVRSDNLQILESKDEYQGPVYIVTAVWCGDVRLIDNLIIST